MSEPVEVVIAGQTLELELPSIGRRSALQVAWLEAGRDAQILSFVMCAALFLCSPDAQRKAGTPRYEQRVLRYGEAVYEYLVGLGANNREIAQAGARALQLVLESFPTESEHEEARGNSEAPSGG